MLPKTAAVDINTVLCWVLCTPLPGGEPLTDDHIWGALVRFAGRSHRALPGVVTPALVENVWETLRPRVIREGPRPCAGHDGDEAPL